MSDRPENASGFLPDGGRRLADALRKTYGERIAKLNEELAASTAADRERIDREIRALEAELAARLRVADDPQILW